MGKSRYQIPELFLPSLDGSMRIPWMDAECGKDEIRLANSQCSHCRPVGFARCVDHAAGDAGPFHGGDDRAGISQARVLEMIVRVDPGEHFLRENAGPGNEVDQLRSGKVEITPMCDGLE